MRAPVLSIPSSVQPISPYAPRAAVTVSATSARTFLGVPVIVVTFSSGSVRRTWPLRSTVSLSYRKCAICSRTSMRAGSDRWSDTGSTTCAIAAFRSLSWKSIWRHGASAVAFARTTAGVSPRASTSTAVPVS